MSVQFAVDQTTVQPGGVVTVRIQSTDAGAFKGLSQMQKNLKNISINSDDLV